VRSCTPDTWLPRLGDDGKHVQHFAHDVYVLLLLLLLLLFVFFS
jgi:hypothetical protein